MIKLNRLAMFCFCTAMAVSLPALETQNSNGINFIAGGISDDERSELAARKDFSLLIKAAAKAGNYLSDVNVKIASAKGATVFEAMMDGPWLLVQLAPGTYTLNASYAGINKTQIVSIPKGGRREAVLYWDVRVED